MKIKRVHADKYSKADLEKLDIALELFGFAINSVQFKAAIESHEQFDTGNNFSNLQIYNIIMSGDEAYTNEGVDFEADLDLTLDPRNSTDAIGYTIRERIYTFQNFFHQLLPTKLAGHYAHEYCHTLGFKDPSDLTDISRNVPYEVGRIVEELVLGSHRTYILPGGPAENGNSTNLRNASIITGSGLPETLASTASIMTLPFPAVDGSANNENGKRKKKRKKKKILFKKIPTEQAENPIKSRQT